jgi:hypothetical protein
MDQSGLGEVMLLVKSENGTQNDKSSPIQIGSDKNWSFVGVGYGVSYGIKTDGTLWAWGFNYLGNYGDETTILRSSPVQVMTNKVGWTEVKGFFHALGLYSPSTTPTKSCSTLSCSTPAFKCYVGATQSCSVQGGNSILHNAQEFNRH